MIAPAASSPATAGGTQPVTSRITIPARMTSARFAPGPSGTACRRTSAGSIDDEQVRIVEVVLERSPGALQEQGVADHELGLAGQVLALALDRAHDEIAALGHHPREHGLADERGARRNDHLRDPRLPAHERVGVVVERVLLGERPGEVAEVPRDRARLPVREQPLAEEHDDRDRPGEQRDARPARTRRSRTCRRRHRPQRSEAITLTGEPVSATSEPA